MWIKMQKITEYKQKITGLEIQHETDMYDKQRLEGKIDNLEKEKDRLRAERDLKNQEIFDLKNEISKLKETNDSLQKENELFRKYYKLDEEPSDEIKLKIHIDLEINRLKEEKENFKTMYFAAAMGRPTIYYPMGSGNCYLR